MARKKQESEYQMSKVEGVGAPSSKTVLMSGDEVTAYYREKKELANKPDEARMLTASGSRPSFSMICALIS